jgi:hypothetical protein
VREQEAQSKGDAERHGLEQPSARHPVRNASEHDSARQVGETAIAYPVVSANHKL